MSHNVPRMTRTHFRLIAEVISQLPFDAQDLRGIANDFALHLRGTNPNFNKDKFIEACLEEVE